MIPSVQLQALVSVTVSPFERRLGKVDDQLLIEVVEEHLNPLRDAGDPDSDTCPLFGGVRIAVDEKVLLGPQCCGDLSDISSWFALISPDFTEGWVALEGHPAPRVERCGESLEFTCHDPDDPFSPGTTARFSVDRRELMEALFQLLEEVSAFSCRVASLHSERRLPVGPNLLLGVDREELQKSLRVARSRAAEQSVAADGRAHVLSGPDRLAMNGNHRVVVLRERDFDVDSLPREEVEADDAS